MATPYDFSDDVRQAQARAMDDENQRRLLAASRPGHGAPVPLAQPPAGPGVGLSDNPLPVAGMGYSVAPVTSVAQVASYTTPSYAPDPVGGYNFVAGRNEAPIRRHVHNLGADGLFIEDYSGPRPAPVTVVSPPAPRPSLLRRAVAGVRRRLGGQ